MVLTDIRLQNYRSHIDSSFELGEKVNIVVGPNTAGKTNLLEAIMVCCSGKSYRAKDADLISKGKAWARLDTHTKNNQQRIVKLKKSDEKIEKTFEIDDKTFKRLPAQYRQPIILFEPNDLFLFHGEPQKRREYIDKFIEQADPQYTNVLNKYKRILGQRNSLLKQPGARGQIFVWDIRLAELGSVIFKERNNLINEINKKLTKIYSEIASKKFKVQIDYLSSINNKNYASALIKELEASLDKDIERGFTGTGPHKDDLLVQINNSNVSNSASRGEVRSLVLALKTIEANVVEERTGKKPIILLDDVFSELDGARRKALTEFLKDRQTIITTTDADVVVKNFAQKSSIISLG